MASPTEEELELILKLRYNIRDIVEDLSEFQRTDMWLLAWLKARDLRLVESEAMLRKSLIWRKENNFEDAIKFIPPKNLEEELPYKFCGFTSEKCPVILVWFGRWDVKKMTDSSGGSELFTSYVRWIMAQIRKQLLEQSVLPHSVVTQFVPILDFEGYSFRQLTSAKCIRKTIHIINEFEDNCPETLKAAFVVNAPKGFSLLFRILKPLLSARTLSKLEVYGSNAAEWKEIVATTIPQDQLPSNYGGKAEAAFARKNQNDPENLTDTDTADSLITVIIPAGKKISFDFDISEPNSMLSWRYRTKQHDIGFSILFENNEDEEVYKYEKVDSPTTEQEGLILCEKFGRYSLVFDNSYSRLRSKTVFYSFKIILPAA